jgi:hypothetical protein
VSKAFEPQPKLGREFEAVSGDGLGHALGIIARVPNLPI